MFKSSPRARPLWAGAALVTFAVAVMSARALWTTHARAVSGRSVSRTSSTANPTTKQKAAALFAFPVSTGVLPKSVTIEYDEGKDRTRMTLFLRGITGSARGFQPGAADVRFTSEFKHQVRDPESGELSVQCVLTLVTGLPGVLAPSDPPAYFTGDRAQMEARRASKDSSGYTSDSKPDGVHESLAFRVRTADLLTLVGSKDVTLTAGALTIRLSGAHLADLREFAARMNPRA